jgi:hypothetical protein
MTWHNFPDDDLDPDDRKYFRWLREKLTSDKVDHITEMAEAGQTRRRIAKQVIKWLSMAGAAIIFVTSLKQPAIDFLTWMAGRK